MIHLVHCCNFSTSNDLTQTVNFPIQIPDSDSHIPGLLELILFFNASIWLSLHWVVLMWLFHFLLTFQQTQNRILALIAMVFMIIWDMFQRRISLNSVLLLLLMNFMSVFRLEFIYMYIPHHKYQVKSHASSWFSAACGVAIVHRNNFFCLQEQNQPSESDVKVRQVSNCCKKVLEAAKRTYTDKTNSPSLPRNSALWTFGKLNIVFSTKVNVLYPLYSTAQMCCLLHLIKQNCFLETFLRTLILMNHISLYLFALLELIYNCIIFL